MTQDGRMEKEKIYLMISKIEKSKQDIIQVSVCRNQKLKSVKNDMFEASPSRLAMASLLQRRSFARLATDSKVREVIIVGRRHQIDTR